jgi:hypothetical protein
MWAATLEVHEVFKQRVKHNRQTYGIVASFGGGEGGAAPRV